jgi:hypothetical protein
VRLALKVVVRNDGDFVDVILLYPQTQILSYPAKKSKSPAVWQTAVWQTAIWQTAVWQTANFAVV